MFERILPKTNALPRETARYIIAGISTTLLNFGVFTLLRRLFGADESVSNIISISLAVLYAFFINKLYVFRRRSQDIAETAAEFLKFTGGRVLTMAFEYFGYFAAVAFLGDLAAKAGMQIIVFAGNYLISKLIVFRKRT